jgi:hypothetical protein
MFSEEVRPVSREKDFGKRLWQRWGPGVRAKFHHHQFFPYSGTSLDKYSLSH